MEKKSMSKNDEAWEILFKKFNILDKVKDNNVFSISATDINEIGKRQARLMTKFDHSNNLPELFRENRLSILPNSRGTYLIGHFKTHHTLEYDEVLKPIRKKFPEEIRTIDANKITSEAVALNTAYFSGMIDDVIETIEGTNSFLTLTNRLGSKELDFFIDSNQKETPPYKISVKNSQIEIDSTYENVENVGVFEAKNSIPNDFLVRQLYYPYLYIKNMNIHKKIMPIFFTYTEDVFSFHIYEFTQPNNYSSIRRVKQMDFVLESNVNISLGDILKIVKREELKPIIDNRSHKDYIPFPQADNMLRVLDLLSFISEMPKTKDEIALNYGFDKRQSDYYFNALKYLGYAEKVKRGKPVSITDEGLRILQIKDNKNGKIEIAANILTNQIFNECMNITLKEGEIISKSDAERVIRKHMPNSTISKETMGRRASSVRGWLNWILNLVEN